MSDLNQNKQRKLAAILFADIQGYTAMMQENEAKAMACLQHYQQVLKEQVNHYQGEIIKNYGDGSLCLFSTVIDAVRCAIAVQERVCKEPLVPLRIGIHLGDVIYRENDIYGNDLNIASRIESMGVPGSVLLSRNVYDKVRNQSEFQFKSLGSFDFKNLKDPMEVYVIANEGLTIPDKKDLKGKFKDVKNRKSVITWALAIGVVALALLYFTNEEFFSEPQISHSQATNTPQKIAVLPLINLNSKDENLEYFSDGVTQEIIDELAQINSLTLTAFTSSIFYKGSSKSPQEIAHDLNVDYLMTGTIRVFSEGDSIKLSLEMLDPKIDDKRIWNESFSERMEDAPSLQNSIAKQVAKSLDLQLSPQEQALIDKTKTQSGEAFRLFLLARSEFMKLNRDGFDKSIEASRQAIALDPNYAQAYTFLAWSHLLSSNPWIEGHYNRSFEDIVEIVSPILEKALELDPKSSDIFLVRGNKKVFIEAKLREGKADVEKALKINSWPLVPTTYCICTVISTYISLNELDKAKEMITLNKDVDPGSVFIAWDTASIYTKEGNFNEAIKFYKEAVGIAPVSMFKAYLGYGYFNANRYRESMEQLLNTYEESTTPTGLNVAFLSNAYYKLGDIESSDKYLKEILDRKAQGEYHLELFLATIYAVRGQHDKALTYLEEALDLKNGGIAMFMNLHPGFIQYYDNPRFIKIREQIQYYKDYPSS